LEHRRLTIEKEQIMRTTDNAFESLDFFVSPFEAMMINLLPVPAHPATTFDDVAFRDALAHSRSLTPEEKVDILRSVPQFSQEQIDTVLLILAEEAEKFGALADRLLVDTAGEGARDGAAARRATFTLIRGGRA
jgi:uncharacterized glyoxalase superfamily protein PhnB